MKNSNDTNWNRTSDLLICCVEGTQVNREENLVFLIISVGAKLADCRG